MQDRFVKRLRKKAKRGMRGWPAATVAYYGPNLDRASKVVVGICRSQTSPVGAMRKWHLDQGDVRNDQVIGQEIIEFLEANGVISVAMTGGIIGCPHEEGPDYEGEWCPVCTFWKGRDRFTGRMIQ